MGHSCVCSVIVPCYNEAGNLFSLYDRVSAVMRRLNEAGTVTGCEYILVDDGSTDATLQIMRELSERDSRIRYISFTRNFGKEAAILAGLTYSVGNFVTLMDADFQDPPELLIEMFAMMNSGSYDCVETRRVDRKGEPPVRSFFAGAFYKVMNLLSDVKLADGVRDFRLMSRRMVDSVLEMRERGRFSKGLFAWTGYRTGCIEYHNTERTGGGSKWSFLKLVCYSLDAIVSFSAVPLQISAAMGGICCLCSLLGAVYMFIQKVFFGIDLPGYALLICSIFLLGGIQLLCLGVLGQYMGRIYKEVKRRPHFLIAETNCVDWNKETAPHN